MNTSEHPPIPSTFSRKTADTPPTIPLTVAVQRAESWRGLVAKIAGSTGTHDNHDDNPIPQQLIFRAININMSDIDWLKQQHPDAASIRLYLSVPNPDYPLQICGMLVPVDAQNKDMLTMADNENISTDEMVNDAASSTIYDFTQPCPTLCNTSSPLFNSRNDVTPYLRYKKQ